MAVGKTSLSRRLSTQALILLVGLATACGEGSTNSSPAAPSTAVATITLTSPSTVAIDSPAATTTVTWSLANADTGQATTVTSDQSWLTVTCAIGDTVISSGCTATGGSGNYSRTVSATANTTTASRSGTLTLKTTGGNSLTVSVTQAATSTQSGPTITVTSSSTLSVGAASQAITVTWSLANADAGHRTLLRTSAGGWLTPDCSQVGDENTSFSNPYQECWYGPGGNGSYSRTVHIAANSSSSIRNGTLTVFDAFSNSITMTVTQAGTTTQTPTRIIALGGNLAFGNVRIGQTSSATLTISNSGNSALTVTGASYPAGFTGNFVGGTIAAGGTQAVTLTFAPTAAQTYSGVVTVTGDQTSGTNTIAVSGTGTAVPAPAVPTITLTSASAISVSVAVQTITVTWTLTNADASHRTLLKAASTGGDKWLTPECSQPGDEDTTNGRADINECWYGPSGNGSFSRTVRVESNGNHNTVRTGSLTLFDAFNNSITISVTQGTTSPVVTLLSPSAYDLTAAAQTITISWRLSGADPAHRMVLETPPRIFFDVWVAQACNQPGDESFSLGFGAISCWLGPSGDGTYSRTLHISTLSTSSNRYGTISLKDAFGNQFTITVHQAVSSPTVTVTVTSADAASRRAARTALGSTRVRGRSRGRSS